MYELVNSRILIGTNSKNMFEIEIREAKILIKPM